MYLYTAHITYHVSWRFTVPLSEIERQLEEDHSWPEMMKITACLALNKQEFHILYYVWLKPDLCWVIVGREELFSIGWISPGLQTQKDFILLFHASSRALQICLALM